MPPHAYMKMAYSPARRTWSQTTVPHGDVTLSLAAVRELRSGTPRHRPLLWWSGASGVWARHQTRHRAATMPVAFRAPSGFTCLNEDASTQARDIHSLLLAVHAPNRSLRGSRRSGLAALAAAMAGRAARGCGDMSGTALHASLTCVTLASSLRNSRC